MPYKDKNKLKEYQKKHYQNNKDAYKESAKSNREKAFDLVWNLKTGKECKCGENDPNCLDFHHLDGKIASLTQAAKNRWSEKRILEEVEKCVLLCANCHLKLHPVENKTENPKGTTLRFRRNRDWLELYKQNCKCSKCGEPDTACLVFHHIGKKKACISTLVDSGYSVNAILEELKKCICLCAKCHRKLHNGNKWNTVL